MSVKQQRPITTPVRGGVARTQWEEGEGVRRWAKGKQINQRREGLDAKSLDLTLKGTVATEGLPHG